MTKISLISKYNPKIIHRVAHLAYRLQITNRTASYNLLLAALVQPFFNEKKINILQIQAVLVAQTHRQIQAIFSDWIKCTNFERLKSCLLRSCVTPTTCSDNGGAEIALLLWEKNLMLL